MGIIRQGSSNSKSAASLLLALFTVGACSSSVRECKPCAGNVIIDLSGFANPDDWASVKRVQVCIDGSCDEPMSVIHTTTDTRTENLTIEESKTTPHSIAVTLLTQSGAQTTASGAGLVFPPQKQQGCACESWHVVYDQQRKALVRA